jgi:hypothetical protein
MLKVYSLIIGEDPRYTSTFQPASKRKIALYANCILVPVILWFVNGYLLVTNVLDGEAYVALLTALVASFIIFLVERTIIMSNGNKSILIFRIILGFVVASLGSITMDEVIFKHDIDNQVASYKQTEIQKAVNIAESEYLNSINEKQSLVNRKFTEWNQALIEAKGEADGTSGSHQKQVGNIARLKMSIADKLEADYRNEAIKLDKLQFEVEQQRSRAKSYAEQNFHGNGFLLRIRAMFDLIKNDRIMLCTYSLVTLFLFCIEFLVVLIKIGCKNSVDEDLEKVREKLLRSKTEKIVDRSLAYFKPEQFNSSVQDANSFLKQNISSLFN